jgi:hypothetical protein
LAPIHPPSGRFLRSFNCILGLPGATESPFGRRGGTLRYDNPLSSRHWSTRGLSHILRNCSRGGPLCRCRVIRSLHLCSRICDPLVQSRSLSRRCVIHDVLHRRGIRASLSAAALETAAPSHAAQDVPRAASGEAAADETGHSVEAVARACDPAGGGPLIGHPSLQSNLLLLCGWVIII